MFYLIRAIVVFCAVACAVNASFAVTNTQIKQDSKAVTNLTDQTNLNGEVAVIVALNEPLDTDNALLASSVSLSPEQIDDIQTKFINNIKTKYVFASYKLSEAPSVVLRIDAKALDAIKRMSTVESIIAISDNLYDQLTLAQ